jgi:hypothetical protein
MRGVRRTIDIEAGLPAVWRALSDPAEVLRWNRDLVRPLDAPADYPRAGQHVRWRYRLGALRLILHDRPTHVTPPTILRSRLRVGPLALDETYTLRAGGPASTRLTAALAVSSALPLLRALLEGPLGHRLARATLHRSLTALKHHCEGAREASVD